MAKSKNDQIIIKTQREIAAKKATLKSAERFVPVTNASLSINGQRYNLHTMNNESDIIALLVALNTYKLSADNLGFGDKFKIDGFTVDEWMGDLQIKLTIVNRKQEEARLKALEAKLHGLLSNETKVELELNELITQV